MLTSQELINLYLGALPAKHDACDTETVQVGLLREEYFVLIKSAQRSKC